MPSCNSVSFATNNMTLLDKLDRIPPWLCRLMAKSSDGRLMSNSELCKRTGWGKGRVRKLCESTSFRHCTVEEVDVFLTACGFHWSNQRRLIFLIGRAVKTSGIQAMRHLRYAPGAGWQASMIKRHQQRIEKLLSATTQP